MNSDDAFCIKIGILNLFWIDCNQFPKQLKYNLDDLIHPGAIIKFFCYCVSWFCKATAHCLAFRIVSDGRNGPKVQMERQTDRQEAVECRRPAGPLSSSRARRLAGNSLPPPPHTPLQKPLGNTKKYPRKYLKQYVPRV